MINKFKQHSVVLLLALGVGVVSVAPQLFFIMFSSEYKGIHMFGADAEHHFVARINEVYEGHYSLGNVFLPDKDTPYLMPGLGENIVAALGRLLHIQAADMNVLSKFIFPPLIYILIYFLILNIFSSKRIAILAALLAMFGTDLMSGRAYIMELVSFSSSTHDFLAHTRPIHPQISALFLFGGLYTFFRALKAKLKIDLKWVLLSGLIFGLSLYAYIYTWSFFVVFAGLYFPYFLFTKNWNKVKAVFSIIAIHGAISIPYWINFLRARVHPFYDDTAMRFGTLNSHEPIFGMWVAILVVVTLFFWPKKYEAAEKFFLLAVLSLWIVLNQQVITGTLLQQAHYHWNITKPFAVASIAAMLFIFLLDRFIASKHIKSLIVLAAVFMLFSHAALAQISSYKYNYPRTVERQKYADLVSYLSAAYPETRVIWTNDMAADPFIASYTAHDSINNNSAIYYLISQDYFIKKLFLQYRMRSVAPKDIGDTLREEKGFVSQYIFGMYYRERFGDRAFLPDAFLERLEREYKIFYASSYEKIFNDLEIDLVVWDLKAEPELMYEDILLLKKVMKINDDFLIYEVDYAV